MKTVKKEIMKKVTFKFKDSEGLTEPRKLKHTCEFEVDEYLRWDRIVDEFQVFLVKLGFDHLSKDKIDLVNLIYRKIDEQENALFDTTTECANCHCDKK